MLTFPVILKIRQKILMKIRAKRRRRRRAFDVNGEKMNFSLRVVVVVVPFPSETPFVLEFADIVVPVPRSFSSFSGRIRLRISSKRKSQIFGRDVLENSLQPEMKNLVFSLQKGFLSLLLAIFTRWNTIGRISESRRTESFEISR